jgi:hypothetical protein
MAAAVITIGAGFILSIGVSVETVLVVWFATTPIASFFARFPTDRSIITFNRAAIALAVVMLLARRRDKDVRERAVVSGFEVAWALLSAVALVSALTKSNDLAYAMRIAVDSFALPLVAFHIARYHFDARWRGAQLVTGAIAVALFLLATGAYELFTGSNLFQYKGSEIVREGAVRVNGPFASDSSYAIISLLIAIFLVAAPRVFDVKMDAPARLIYWCAVGAAIAASLLPLFRMVAVALVISLALYKIATLNRGEKAGLRPRRGNPNLSQITPSPSPLFRFSPFLAWAGLALLAIAIWAVMFGPYSAERRLTDPRSAYGRLATWESAASLALENPATGVGLANYTDAFHEKYNFRGEIKLEVMETRAADSPHSNLLWVAAELGLPALVLYAAANLSLLVIGYRALRRPAGRGARAAAACYVALLVAYWLAGLTLASGYYSDLNLYFFFLLGLLSNEEIRHKSNA